MSKLKTLVVDTENENACIIWLHGLGANANDLMPIINNLNIDSTLNIKHIFPEAKTIPVTINHGMPTNAWYDVRGFDRDTDVDFEQINESVSSIMEIIDEQLDFFPSEKIMLLGFSQGALIALTTALVYEKKLAGAIALSGYLVNFSQVMDQVTANKNLNVFVGHGTEDEVVPIELAQKLVTDLQSEESFNLEFHPYDDLGHSINNEELNDINSFINKILTNL